MIQLILKQEYVDIIKSDPLLYGKVAYLLGVAPYSLRTILDSNSAKLTQVAILKAIQQHCKLEGIEILTEEVETESV